jgi:hypothetical protein
MMVAVRLVPVQMLTKECTRADLCMYLIHKILKPQFNASLHGYTYNIITWATSVQSDLDLYCSVIGQILVDLGIDPDHII